MVRGSSPGSPAKSFAGVTQSGQSASPTKRKPVVRIHPPAPSVAVVLRVQHSRLWPSQYGFKSHRSPQLPCPCRLTARIAPFQGADDSSILSTGTKLAASTEAPQAGLARLVVKHHPGTEERSPVRFRRAGPRRTTMTTALQKRKRTRDWRIVR